jgi:hypothetical protein
MSGWPIKRNSAGRNKQKPKQQRNGSAPNKRKDAPNKNGSAPKPLTNEPKNMPPNCAPWVSYRRKKEAPKGQISYNHQKKLH